MTTVDAIRILAGTLVLGSVALSHFVNPAWLSRTAFVGLNLIQSTFTGFCPAEIILNKLGITKIGCCAKPTEHS